jgi:hypothetical protein
MKKLFLIPALISFVTLSGCFKKNTTSPINTPNLITNSSFESNGQSSFTGWQGDTSTYSFVNDTFSNSGYWCLQLVPCWLPCEGAAETYVTGLTGTHNYYFSCYTKCYGWTGKVMLRKLSNGVLTDLGSFSFSNKTWEPKSFWLYNLSLSSTDKLIVHLSAGGAETFSGRVLFDKVSLQKQ